MCEALRSTSTFHNSGKKVVYKPRVFTQDEMKLLLAKKQEARAKREAKRGEKYG